MSYEVHAPVPPRPATQADIIRQIENLRARLQQEILRAQQAASQKAAEEAKKRIQVLQQSIANIAKSTQSSIDALDKKHQQHMLEITRRIYDDLASSQEKAAKEVKRQLDDLSSGIHKEIADTETRINKSVSKQINRLATDISDRMKGIDKRIDKQQEEIQAINAHMEDIVSSINDMAAEIDDRFLEDEKQIQEIQQDIADIHKRFFDEEALAQQTVQDAVSLLDAVEKRTLLDRFAPGNEAQDIRVRVRSLAEEGRLHGAALTAKAEEAITQIWQTERHAVQEKAKHDAMVEITLEQVEKVLTWVNSNREFETPVEGGDPMVIENDFWSRGEYGLLEKELNDLKAELADRYNGKLNRARLEAIARRSAEIQARLIQINAESVAKAILSESRVETIDDLVNAMEHKGWQVKGGHQNPEVGYLGGEEEHDWREGFCAVLENAAGEEITVIMDPVDDSVNQLIVHQEGTDAKTEKAVQATMQIIQQQLCDQGFQVGQTQSSVNHIPEMGSAKRLGERRASQRVREKIQ